MAQEYKLTSFDPGKDPFMDQNGNTWCTATFEGHGEPVKWVVKDLSKITVGDNYYGEMKEVESKAGKMYWRFYRQSRPDAAPGQQSFSSKKEWQPRDDSAIKAQFSIKAAVQAVGNIPGDSETHAAYFDNVEFAAKQFYDMVDRVKGGEQKAPAPTGYEKAKAVAASLPKSEPELDLSDEPISLADIPF